jgi:hypothetical protein
MICDLVAKVHLKFSLYTNCQNRPCGKKFNTIACANLHIYNVYVNIILWRNLNIVSTKLFPQSDLLKSKFYLVKFQFCYALWHWHHGWRSIRYTHLRSLSRRISWVNKIIQSVISTPKKCKIYTSSWNSFGIILGRWEGYHNIQITNFCRIIIM